MKVSNAADFMPDTPSDPTSSLSASMQTGGLVRDVHPEMASSAA
jgi:hypothetical protein